MKTCIQSGQTLLFIGDSITDCDRTVPNHNPLGWGFVRLFADLLMVREPEKSILVLNKGRNGNTISHLLSRWSDDVIENEPNFVFILIGINDATRYLDKSTSLHLPPLEYKLIYRRLVDETFQRLPQAQVILLEPFFISKGDNIVGSYRNELITGLSHYICATRSVADEFGLRIVQLSNLFTNLLICRNSASYSEDKIHPNSTGHLAIAEAVYSALKN